MWFETLIREETGCAAYMIGCQGTGQCAVFDPVWDIQPYLDMAKEKESTIRYVIDSHSHADHVSGARWLAEVTGAELIIPELAEIEYEATRVKHGDEIRMGGVGMEFVHVPGHRPEQINLLVRDYPRGEEPWFILTADFVLVGDVARPDLAQAGEEGAPVLFDVAIPRFLDLPDHVEVYPGHLAGSTWGRVTSGKVATTVGYERLYNDALKFTDRDAFTEYMQEEQPVKPANIANIVATNQGKLPLTMAKPVAKPLSAAQVEELMGQGHIIVDTRSSAEFGVGHIPDAYHAHLSSPEFEQRIGWVTPLDTPIILVTNDAEEAQRAIYNMAFIALDTRVTGYLDGGMDAWMDAGKVMASLPQMDVFTLHHRLSSNGLQVLDVREDDEYDEGHIEVAKNLSFKLIPTQMDKLELDKEKPLAITCATGKRSSTAASLLLRAGFQELYNVTGGMTAWESAGFDTVFFEE